MNISKEKLRKIIHESLGHPESHRCMDGTTVPFGSNECVADMQMRIEDAIHFRDACPGRTDSRQHYNGILNVLRRNLRAAKKENDVINVSLEEL